MKDKSSMQAITQGAYHLAMQIVGCEDEAKDILQAAFEKTMSHKRAPKPSDQGFKAWFYRVVHNQSIDWLRREKRFQRDHDFEGSESHTLSQGEQLDQHKRKQLLHQALNLLTTEHREIICLKDFHELSYDEIANVLAIEKGTVMSRLHRARLALKKQLTELGMH